MCKTELTLEISDQADGLLYPLDVQSRCRSRSTGDRTILGKISKRPNRYLRVLFAQAAWGVLVKPQRWERSASTMSALPPKADILRGGLDVR